MYKASLDVIVSGKNLNLPSHALFGVNTQNLRRGLDDDMVLLGISCRFPVRE